jgi:BirA family biotin operon repressor/biotin-[acetyl-CoA-carboxylase] ligase
MFELIEVLTSVDSTNEFIKRYISAGISRVVVAESQTRGKGRLGRQWYSPAGEGLYVSFLFFPGWESSRVEQLNAVVSLSVLESLNAATGGTVKVRLKPPNDVYVGRRKLAGILAESSISGNQIQWVIAGVGVNLRQCEFPDDLEGKATSLRLESVEDCEPMHLCQSLTGFLTRYINRAESGDWGQIQSEYEKARQ